MKRILMLSALTGVLAITGCAKMSSMIGMDKSSKIDVQTTTNNMAPVKSMNGMLVDLYSDMTLYTFDKDEMGKSNCAGDCLKAWPALKASANAKASGQFTTIQRDDGTYQWAANGKPLYYFVKDMKAGDMMGEGMGGVWRTVKTQ